MADPPPLQPPQYPVYPYPPPHYGFRPPSKERMPGLTTTSVVLLCVMCGIGVIDVLLTGTFALLHPELLGITYPGLGSMLPWIVAVMLAQGLAWTVMRVFLAVNIARRSARARTAAIVVETIGLAFQVSFLIVLFSAVAADPPDGSFNISFNCTGIVLPILVLCFLSSTRSRQWCDR